MASRSNITPITADSVDAKIVAQGCELCAAIAEIERRNLHPLDKWDRAADLTYSDAAAHASAIAARIGQ